MTVREVPASTEAPAGREPRGSLVLLAAPLVALGFLTVVPIPVTPAAAERAFGRAVGFFPLVGALLGLAVAGADAALGLVLPHTITSAIDLALFTLLTSALHVDGLMDSCDGLFVQRTPDERLAIMRDSRVGSFGVVGGLLVLLVQYACLAELNGPLRFGGLVAMATVGRWAMSYATVCFPYGRSQGLGSAFKRSAGWRDLVFATAAAAAVVAATFGPAGLALIGIGWLGAWTVASFALSRVPGLTGDVYGAIEEIGATLTLLALVAASAAGSLR